jgi:hypothetical protein
MMCEPTCVHISIQISDHFIDLPLENFQTQNTWSITANILWHVLEMNVAFKISYVYDYITKFCRIQTEVVLNYLNSNVAGTGQGKARHRKYNNFRLGGG